MSDVTRVDARSGLVIALTNLPQAAAVTSTALTCDYDDLRLMTGIEFCTMLEEWISAYSGVVSTMRTTAANMASELSELRSQRVAIRSFLGINQGDS